MFFWTLFPVQQANFSGSVRLMLLLPLQPSTQTGILSSLRGEKEIIIMMRYPVAT